MERGMKEFRVPQDHNGGGVFRIKMAMNFDEGCRETLVANES
jgi:hypothetical protein